MEEEAAKKRGRRGRPKGSYSKASKAQVARLTEAGKLSPLDYLASIYQDESEDIRLRVEAAKAAAPYVHARLASTEVRAALTEVSQEEWLQSLR
tara:strand:+ start:1172 stop:1453 length:282 start_codon:yes stop_codon:yes gene_type:complete